MAFQKSYSQSRMKNTLEYILALKDNMTPKVKSVVGEIDKIGTRGKDAVATLGAGLAGLVGVGASLHSAIAPALELDRALGELTKLDVAENAIESVKDKALQLSTVIGESAESIAKNAYNVKKAINGINDADLAEVNNTVHLLGTVTRTSSESAAKYMGVLHSVFNKQAKELGEAKWADQIAGKTEKATKLYGTSLDNFQSGFAKLSNSVSKYGISFDEQIAIMGELTRVTGNGGVAAAKYQKIIKGLGKAQTELGLKFSDSKGKMLAMPEILDKIRAKYGQKIPIDKLKKSLGEDAASALIHLLNQTDKLKADIREINETTDGKGLINTAADASDGFLKLSAAFANLRTAIGSEMLKVLYPSMDKLAEWGNLAVTWITNNKEMSATLAKVTLGFFGLMAIAPVLLTVVGIFKMLSAGTATLALPLKMLGLIPFEETSKGASKTANSVKVLGKSGAGLKGIFSVLGKVLTNPFSFAGKAILGLGGIFPKITGKASSAIKSVAKNGLSLKGVFASLAKVSLFSNAKTAILGLGGTFGKVLGIFTSKAKFFYAVGFGIGKVFLALGKILLGVKAILAVAFSPITIAIGLIIAFRKQIAAFVGGFVAGFQQVGLSFAPLSNAFERIKSIFGGVVKKFAEIFGVSEQNIVGLESWANAGKIAGEMVAKGIALVIDIFADILVGVAELVAFFATNFARIIELWQNVTTAFQNEGWLAALKTLVSGIFTIFNDILHDVKVLAIKAINWLIEKFNQFTGTKFKPIEIPVKMDIPPLPKEFKAVGVSIAGSVSSVAGQVASGGITTLPSTTQPQSYKASGGKSISKTLNSTQTKNVTNHINVNVQGGNADAARAIDERLRMGG